MSDPVNWQDEAACVGMSIDLFFPDAGRPTAEALDVCAGCPVRGDCLAFALSNRIDDGLWGGLMADERRREARRSRRRRRDAAVCGTTGGYKRHRALGEQACPSCVAAWSEYSRNYKASRRLSAVAS